MQELSPFVFGNLVSLQSFTNRENDLKILKKNLVSGINTIIISPRRWGKSSLVEKVIAELNRETPTYKTVKIDLFSVNSEEEFLELFAKEILKASSAKWEEWLKDGKEIFNKLIPKLSIGVQPDSDFSISFDWQELKKHSDEILHLPEILAERKNIKFIICIDEFQNLAQFRGFEGLEKKMRASWQKHKNAVYCLYGSKRHMMKDIFNNSSKPFYKFGDLFYLKKIEKQKWISFITTNFKLTNRNISVDFAEKIADLMKNHPWYVQQFSFYVWSATENEVKIEIFNDSLERLIQSNTPFFQELINEFSIGQINLLKAILKGEKQLSAKEILKKYNLGTSANVVKNKKVLLEKDIINIENETLEFLDPVFELWFKKIYFNENYLSA